MSSNKNSFLSCLTENLRCYTSPPAPEQAWKDVSIQTEPQLHLLEVHVTSSNQTLPGIPDASRAHPQSACKRPFVPHSLSKIALHSIRMRRTHLLKTFSYWGRWVCSSTRKSKPMACKKPNPWVQAPGTRGLGGTARWKKIIIKKEKSLTDIPKIIAYFFKFVFWKNSKTSFRVTLHVQYEMRTCT